MKYPFIVTPSEPQAELERRDVEGAVDPVNLHPLHCFVLQLTRGPSGYHMHLVAHSNLFFRQVHEDGLESVSGLTRRRILTDETTNLCYQFVTRLSFSPTMRSFFRWQSTSRTAKVFARPSQWDTASTK
jgi:hypothetical protein